MLLLNRIKTEKFRCHGLAPWSLTFFCYRVRNCSGQREPPRDKPVASSLSALDDRYSAPTRDSTGQARGIFFFEQPPASSGSDDRASHCVLDQLRIASDVEVFHHRVLVEGNGAGRNIKHKRDLFHRPPLC
jgi:hypothetical protein